LKSEVRMSRRKTFRNLLAVVVIIAAYIGLFFGLRNSCHVIDYDEDGIARRMIQICYFSENDVANKVWFYFFFPLHTFVGRPYFSTVITEQDFDEYHGTPYYAYESSLLGFD
jgi:hypothetical protein